MSSLVITLDGLYDTNRLLNGLYSRNRGSSFLGAKMKRESREKVSREVMEQINDYQIKWPAYLLFEWHPKDHRKDPDNLSSGARKAIFDGMQRVVIDDTKDEKDRTRYYLPNDNSKYILGFADNFVYDKPEVPFVKIKTISKEQFLQIWKEFNE